MVTSQSLLPLDVVLREELSSLQLFVWNGDELDDWAKKLNPMSLLEHFGLEDPRLSTHILYQEAQESFLFGQRKKHFTKLTQEELDSASISFQICSFRSNDKKPKDIQGATRRQQTKIKNISFKRRHFKYQNDHWFSRNRDRYDSVFVVTLERDGTEIHIPTNLEMMNALWGPISVNDQLQIETRDGNFQIDESQFEAFMNSIDFNGKYYYYSSGGSDKKEPFNFTLSGLQRVCSDVFKIEDETSLQNIALYLLGKLTVHDQSLKGVTKLHKKIAPIAEDLRFTHPLTYFAFREIIANAHRTINKVKISSVFNSDLGHVETQEDLVNALKPLKFDFKIQSWRGWFSFDDSVQEMPSFKTKRKAAIKATSDRAFSLLMQEYEFLNLDEEAYPVLCKAIKDGDIPIGIFFRKKEQYFLLNDNFQLWEEMLTSHYEVSVSIAQEAARRTTYEKDIMSYFYFVLYKLPTYLERHTGRKWTCIPKLINSPNELDPPKDDGTGTVRRRSALTPDVDNEKNTVVVPYASLAMPGRQTTYCYGLTFEVLEKGMNFMGNAVTSDLEEKLNGFDDYGLMFYTLTGSAQGRGYPTFLIIFEKRAKETFVHFHRTHPSRSKSGDYNPVHNWTKVCYNWMVGNVNKNRIVAQQGDLVFIEDTKEREFNKNVDRYDNHIFGKAVEFAEDTRKNSGNVLGYLRIGGKIPAPKEGIELQHHEHEWVKIPCGQYEVRQCRSWEANPKGVWSLRID